MKVLDTLQKKANRLENELTALYHAYQHPDIPVLPKIIVIVTLGYALSPIDLIPDFIPVLGYLDDLIIIPALISFSITLIPDAVMTESRRKAEEEPLVLKKNRVFAGVIVLIWIALLAAIISSIIGLLK